MPRFKILAMVPEVHQHFCSICDRQTMGEFVDYMILEHGSNQVYFCRHCLEALYVDLLQIFHNAKPQTIGDAELKK